MHRNETDIPAQTAGDVSPAAVPTPGTANGGSPRWVNWLISPAGRALAALVLILLIGCVFNAEGSFFKAGTHRDALRQVSVYGILACGLTLVIVSGGIDLAVGSVLALVAVAFSILTIDWGLDGYVAVPLVLLLGAATGAASGATAAWGRVQPFIATLAMMVFARGAAKWMTGGAKVQPYRVQDGQFMDLTPPMFQLVASRILGGNVSVVTLIFAAVALVSWVLLSRHRWGRQLYAVGGNEKAAALSGVAVNRVKLWAYVLSGTFAAIAGICQAAQEKQGDPNVGMGYELTAIAIVVIGGTSLMGGRGGIGLTILGTLTIGYLEKILSLNAVSEAGRLMLTGLIIVVAVLAQRRRV
jgi:ribose transport system permease protein